MNLAPLWLNPAEYPPPRGKTILLCTAEFRPVVGQWQDEGYIGWLPEPKKPMWMLEKMRKTLDTN